MPTPNPRPVHEETVAAVRAQRHTARSVCWEVWTFDDLAGELLYLDGGLAAGLGASGPGWAAPHPDEPGAAVLVGNLDDGLGPLDVVGGLGPQCPESGLLDEGTHVGLGVLGGRVLRWKKP